MQGRGGEVRASRGADARAVKFSGRPFRFPATFCSNFQLQTLFCAGLHFQGSRRRAYLFHLLALFQASRLAGLWLAPTSAFAGSGAVQYPWLLLWVSWLVSRHSENCTVGGRDSKKCSLLVFPVPSTV